MTGTDRPTVRVGLEREWLVANANPRRWSSGQAVRVPYEPQDQFATIIDPESLESDLLICRRLHARHERGVPRVLRVCGHFRHATSSIRNRACIEQCPPGRTESGQKRTLGSAKESTDSLRGLADPSGRAVQ